MRRWFDPESPSLVVDAVVFIGIVIFVIFVGTVWAVPPEVPR